MNRGTIGILVFLLAVPLVAQAEITRTLSLGSSGSDVSELQEDLAQDPSIYPEAQVTGYFGVLTREAVRRFQIKHSIVSSGDEASTGFGVVGPKTRATLHSTLHNNETTSTTDTTLEGGLGDWLQGAYTNRTTSAGGSNSNTTDELVRALQARVSQLSSQVSSLKGLGGGAGTSATVTYLCKYNGVEYHEGQTYVTNECWNVLGVSGQQCGPVTHTCRGGRFIPAITPATASCTYGGTTYQHGAYRYGPGSCLGSSALCPNATAFRCRNGAWIQDSLQPYGSLIGTACDASAARDVDVPIDTLRCKNSTCYYVSEPSTATLHCVNAVWTDE